MSTHLVVEDDAAREAVLQIKGRALALIEPYDFEHVTIEIEYEGEECRLRDSQTIDG